MRGVVIALFPLVFTMGLLLGLVVGILFHLHEIRVLERSLSGLLHSHPGSDA